MEWLILILPSGSNVSMHTDCEEIVGDWAGNHSLCDSGSKPLEEMISQTCSKEIFTDLLNYDRAKWIFSP